MRLLLLSRGIGAVPEFIDRTTDLGSRRPRLGYVTDAASAYPDAPFVTAERAAVAGLGHDVTELSARSASAQDLSAFLDDLDALYVASGGTFALLAALRSTGADRAITERVRGGLPYIGASAGAIVAGTSIEPASLMDDPGEAPGLHDYSGLQLLDGVVIPHADGKLPPYPPELIERTQRRYGADHHLIPLRDDQALLVDGADARIVDSVLTDG